jgi:hypothetical protein
MHDEADQKRNQENDEQQFRDAGGGDRESTEPEYARHDGDYQKNKRPIQHNDLLFSSRATAAPWLAFRVCNFESNPLNCRSLWI